ncbi:Cyclin-dependent kinase [Paramyrothecium foliicola]|nr:Cyclin-dependent kinase [Paramyrothecium foliicola]
MAGDHSWTPPPMVERLPSLASEILQKLVVSAFDDGGRKFLPRGSIDKLVTKVTIAQELQLATLDWHTAYLDIFATWVLTQAPRLFLIVLKCGLKAETAREALRCFQHYGFTDALLPVQGSPSLSDKSHFHCSYWDDLTADRFTMNQWEYLAPVFEPARYHYNLQDGCVLPFIQQDPNRKEGAFSYVYKVVIHPEHNGHNIQEVAIKEIRVTRGSDQANTSDAWEREARALESINKIDHPHIIQCLAAISRKDNRYFMFPWATGGSLRDFWEAFPVHTTPMTQRSLIQQALHQLQGLALALDKLHNFEAEPLEVTISPPNDEQEERRPGNDSIRHGDLKPENLLRFATSNMELGTLKIADMGLAKKNIAQTVNRKCLTTTRYSTIQYQAPEADTSLQGLSRLYDIWSMGCIIFEFVIWLLYGNKRLELFYLDLQGSTRQACPYFELQQGDKAKVHQVVTHWMDHMQAKEPECARESALGDLLRLVRQRLLVVELPPARGRTLREPSMTSMGVSGITLIQPSEPVEGGSSFRATAEVLHKNLTSILQRVMRDQNYVLTATETTSMTPAPALRSYSSALSPNVGLPRTNHISPSNNAQGPIVPAPIRLKDWQFQVDNDFAKEVVREIGPEYFLPQMSEDTRLCDRCFGLDFGAAGFSFEDQPLRLQTKSPTCNFCKLLASACSRMGVDTAPKVRFDRIASTLRLVGGPPLPALSIFQSPETQAPVSIQLGLAQLLDARQDAFFSIVRLWLQDCDRTHGDCRGHTATALPTRLIDVGTESNPGLRLLETSLQAPEENKYIALSHPWGDRKLHPPFCTWRTDINGDGHDLESFKKAIPAEQLPATFKDAIAVTRALQIRYLWIDSVCIIQGKDGDFNDEAERMEDVFSGAYCVLAASRASGQHDGFLGSRPTREVVRFQRLAEKPFHVCEPIDDFNHDVLQSPLNSRGWVLQERALARRTVFFAASQAYFECGHGIRCETLSKMHNNLTDFLGDPKFPEKAMQKRRGFKIAYFQDLYKQYTRLGFTRIEDRALAILGLESRLCKAYGTQGRFGIFDDGPAGGLFHRSLLWRRGEEETLKGMSPIVFSLESRRTTIPSWSWMAYRGAIDYLLEPPFEELEWETDDIHPPWSKSEHIASPSDKTRKPATSPRVETPHELVITARQFNVAGSRNDEAKVLYDALRSASDGRKLFCVVVAKTKTGASVLVRKHYVLIVAMNSTPATLDGHKTFHRMGVGHMLVL